MNKIKTFLTNNKKLSYIFIFVWLAFCIFASYYGAKASGDEFDSVCSYVKNTIEVKSTIGAIIKNGIFNDLKFLVSILIISLSPFLCPCAVFLTFAKGFACGITSVILFRLYSLKASAAVFLTIVIPQMLILPIYMTMIILSVKYPFSRIKADKTETAYDKRRQWLSFALLQLILTAVLICVSVLESLIIQAVYPILN